MKMLSISGKGGEKVGAKVTVHKHPEPLLDFLNFSSEIQASVLLRPTICGSRSFLYTNETNV